MTLQALLFDFDGLILDTELPQYLTVKAEFEAHGVELPLDEWLDIIGRVDLEHWLDWLDRITDVPVEREIVRARRLVRHHELIMRNEILPGVVELLAQAEARGLPVAVVSSSPVDWVGGHLERLGIVDRFAVVVTREQAARSKPFPDLFLVALDRLGVDAGAAVAFEDSNNGSAAAKAAGLFCVVAPNEMTRAQDFAHADLVVASLANVDLDDVDQHLRLASSRPR